MDWYEFTDQFHGRTGTHGWALSSLPLPWQRELAALWRLEADVNNGAYLQFIANWGRESHELASQALKKIGATRMSAIVEECRALIDEHWVDKPLDFFRQRESLPQWVIERIYVLSYEFMDYPDDIAGLGMHHYQRYMSDETA